MYFDRNLVFVVQSADVSQGVHIIVQRLSYFASGSLSVLGFSWLILSNSLLVSCFVLSCAILSCIISCFILFYVILFSFILFCFILFFAILCCSILFSCSILSCSIFACPMLSRSLCASLLLSWALWNVLTYDFSTVQAGSS